jgi:hypothetical protein
MTPLETVTSRWRSYKENWRTHTTFSKGNDSVRFKFYSKTKRDSPISLDLLRQIISLIYPINRFLLSIISP